MERRKTLGKQGLFIILFLLYSFTVAAEDTREKSDFQWALLIKNSRNDTWTTSERWITLKPEDKYKFIFKPGKGSHIYLYSLEEDNKLTLLFPGSFEDFGEGGPELYFFPSGKSVWMTVEDKVKFYLMASPKKLKKLEELTPPSLHYTRGGGTVDSAGIRELLKEINLLLKQFSHNPGGVWITEQKTGIMKGDEYILYKVLYQDLYAKVISVKPMREE